MKEKRKVITEPLEVRGVAIRTKRMPAGVANYWSRDDIAHVWVDDKFYRVTKNGTLLEQEVPGPKTVRHLEMACLFCKVSREHTGGTEFSYSLSGHGPVDTKVWICHICNGALKFFDTLREVTGEFRKPKRVAITYDGRRCILCELPVPVGANKCQNPNCRQSRKKKVK